MDSIEGSFGKYPSSLGNVAILEYNYVQDYVNSYLSNLLSNPALQIAGIATQNEFLNSNSTTINLEQFCMMVVMTKKNRLDTYLKNQAGRNSDIIAFSDQVAMALGINFPVIYFDILNKQLASMSFAQIFSGEVI